MLYRETGQFKTTYASDQQLFPILQDRIFVIGFLLFAFAAVPFLGFFCRTWYTRCKEEAVGTCMSCGAGTRKSCVRLETRNHARTHTPGNPTRQRVTRTLNCRTCDDVVRPGLSG